MKERISATIDKDTKRILEEVMKSGRYRNMSHVIEEAIKMGFGKDGLKKWMKK